MGYRNECLVGLRCADNSIKGSSPYSLKIDYRITGKVCVIQNSLMESK